MPGFGGGNSKNKVVMGPVSVIPIQPAVADEQMNRGIRLSYAMASDPPDLQDFEAYPSVCGSQEGKAVDILMVGIDRRGSSGQTNGIGETGV
jgi:hypothetical protein